MGFRENLKTELVYQNIMVKELAQITGISRHTLDNYLNVRENMPTVDVAVKIAKALGVTVEYLVTGEEMAQEKSMLGTEMRALMQNFRLLCEDDRKMLIGIAQLVKKHGSLRSLHTKDTSVVYSSFPPGGLYAADSGK
ncbi:MAG: helix-turn-helix domain-containing protein [Treponema sp.]|nr:helix-turn-helix domain-containing protein [Treponema sp.]